MAFQTFALVKTHRNIQSREKAGVWLRNDITKKYMVGLERCQLHYDIFYVIFSLGISGVVFMSEIWSIAVKASIRLSRALKTVTIHATLRIPSHNHSHNNYPLTLDRLQHYHQQSR